MVDGGALLPLGSDRDRVRTQGYGLAIMVDSCGVLSGANWGPFAPPLAFRQEIPKRSVGKAWHFFGAMRIGGFMDGIHQASDRRLHPRLSCTKPRCTTAR